MKSTSIVTTGEIKSSISFSSCGSMSVTSVPSKRVSSWLSEVRAAKLVAGLSVAAGSWATCTKGGGRDKAVLMGRVVTLAVTGRGLSRLGGSCLMKGEISEKTIADIVRVKASLVLYLPSY